MDARDVRWIRRRARAARNQAAFLGERAWRLRIRSLLLLLRAHEVVNQSCTTDRKAVPERSDCQSEEPSLEHHPASKVSVQATSPGISPSACHVGAVELVKLVPVHRANRVAATKQVFSAATASGWGSTAPTLPVTRHVFAESRVRNALRHRNRGRCLVMARTPTSPRRRTT
jgi:hypothetical protein